MIRNKSKVSALCFATLAIFVASLTLAEATIGYLPPDLEEKSSARIAEKEAGIDYNARAVDNYRLPNNTVPIHYDIELTTNVHNGTTSFSGKVQIILTATEDTRTIVLHARQLTGFIATIQNGTLANAAAYNMTVSYETDREFLSLTPTNTGITLYKNTTWTLTITYTGNLRTDRAGFHILSYTDAQNRLHYMATTQFESTNARHAFPCYDEPAMRATFGVTIRHDPSYSALSNMPKNETASSTGVTVFQRTNITIPTYLVAFHVSDYAYTEGSLHELPHRLYSKPQNVSDHQFGLVSGILILQSLADYYNVSFALPQMAQVAVPGKGGAMENWGLVTYGEQYLLFNKTTSTTSTQLSIANIIAHEFTHQWFGNHVAVRWWTYLWLKEGFATLFSYQAVDEVYPEWDVYQTMHTSDYQSALSNDGIGTVVPMTHYAQTPAEISARYGTSSYAKPACVLHMWQHALGDKVFRAGLNKYLTDNAFNSAEEWQLFEALQSAANEHRLSLPASINVMFPTWSQQSGYPLLTVTRDYTANKFTVQQTAFNDNSTVNSGRTYYVPFNYASRSEPDFRNTTATNYLLNVKEINITDATVGATDWLILNKQSSGYYRINYDERNWQLIAEGLVERPQAIHPRNRAQLLYDAYKFVSTYRLPHNILLKLLTYLPGEDQYAPWSAANAIINNYNAYLSGDADYDDFKYFIKSLVNNTYELLGVNDVHAEPLLRKYTRNIVVNVACLVGVENCLTDSNNKLKALISKNVAIEPNVRSQAYCNGLRHSSDTEYNHFLNELFSSSDATYRNYLLRGLGCSQDSKQLERYVNSSIDQTKSLTSSERTTLLSTVYSRGSTGLLVSIEFLSNNFETYGNLSESTGAANPLSRDIVSMSNYVNNKSQEEKLLALVNKVKTSNKVQANLETTVQTNMNVNFNWLNLNSKQVISFVKSYRSSARSALNASLLSVFVAVVMTISRFF
uniref:Aminopeptidase n=1 Tax=Ceratitis capitata TaxID=7213 RepID=W8BQH0_CERCA